jgi:protein-tyrosine phosphatase
MAQRGIDLSERRSSAITPQSIADADLILGMTREHVREVVGLAPDAWTKTYTLKDFIRRAQQAGPRRRRQRLDGWLDVVGAERTPQDVLGSDPADEVHDPFGQRAKVWEQVIDDIDDLVSPIPTLLRLREERQSPNRAWSA